MCASDFLSYQISDAATKKTNNDAAPQEKQTADPFWGSRVPSPERGLSKKKSPKRALGLVPACTPPPCFRSKSLVFSWITPDPGSGFLIPAAGDRTRFLPPPVDRLHVTALRRSELTTMIREREIAEEEGQSLETSGGQEEIRYDRFRVFSIFKTCRCPTHTPAYIMRTRYKAHGPHTRLLLPSPTHCCLTLLCPARLLGPHDRLFCTAYTPPSPESSLPSPTPAPTLMRWSRRLLVGMHGRTPSSYHGRWWNNPETLLVLHPLQKRQGVQGVLRRRPRRRPWGTGLSPWAWGSHGRCIQLRMPHICGRHPPSPPYTTGSSVTSSPPPAISMSWSTMNHLTVRFWDSIS